MHRALIRTIFFIFLINLNCISQIDSIKIKFLEKKAYSICEEEPLRTITLGREVLEISNDQNFVEGQSIAFNLIGVGYDVLANYDSALYYYNLALIKNKQISNPSLKASIFNNIGLTYWNKSEYKLAITAYYQALNLFKKINDIKGLAKTNSNLGLLYNDMLDNNSALLNFNEAIHYYNLLNDNKGISIVYLNMGITYHEMGQNKNAEAAFRASYNLKNEDEFYGKSLVLLNWASVKNSDLKTDTAILLLNQAIVLKEKINDTEGLIVAHNTLANIYITNKQYKKAIADAQRAIFLNKTAQSKKRFIRSYAILKRAYIYLNFPDSSFKYNDLEYKLKDSIFSKNLSDAVASEKVKYNTLTVENENLLLKLDTKEQKFKFNILVVSFTFGILFIIIILIYANRIRKVKLLATQQRQQNLANQTIFETEQNERSRIARDLHDSIGQMLAFIKMQNNQIDDAPISKAIDKTIDEVRNISHELMPPELNFGLTKALQTLIIDTKLQTQLNINEAFTNANFTDSFKITIYRIMQELVNNTIKYAQATQINFSAEKINLKITFKFFTDGRPINESNLQNSKGIGWQNINARLLLLNGNIKIENSAQQNGFVLNLNLPNDN